MRDLAVAVPSCYLTSLERLFATIGPQDAEQNITGQVAFGLEHSDYLTLHAPRPTLICAATHDFFDIQGTWTTFREAKRIYGLLGHGERVDLFESDSGHGFPRPQREAMLRWMRRWLLGKDDAPVEEDIPIAADAELQCTRSGQVLEDLNGKSVFLLNAERAQELASQRTRWQAERSREELLKNVARLIAVTLPVPAAKRKNLGSLERDSSHIDKVIFTTDPGIVVPGLLFRQGAKGRGPLVLYLQAKGMAVDAGPDGAIEKLVKSGHRVLALDLRGMGETAPGALANGRPNFFGVDFKEAFLALHLDRPLLGQRVGELLAVVQALAADTPEGFHLIARGTNGPVALHAAVLDRRIKQLILGQSLVSWSNVVQTPISNDQLTNVVPGALKWYDLPELAATLAPRPLTICQAVDAAGKPLTQAALESAYTAVRTAYHHVQAEKSLILETCDK